MQSRFPCGWILRGTVRLKKSLILQNNLIYQYAKKSILELIIRNLLCHSNPLLLNYCFCSQPWLECYFCVFDFSHGKPSAGWQSNIHMDWVQKPPERHCWNSWPCMQRARSALAEQGFTAGFHFVAYFKSGWALIFLFLQPSNGKGSHWMRVWGVTVGLWFLLMKNTDCACIHLGNLRQRRVKMTKLRSQKLSFPMFSVQH